MGDVAPDGLHRKIAALHPGAPLVAEDVASADPDLYPTGHFRIVLTGRRTGCPGGASLEPEAGVDALVPIIYEIMEMIDK